MTYGNEDLIQTRGVEFLFRAVTHNSLAVVQFLLACNPSIVDCRDEEGLTPLMLAAEQNGEELTALLLAYGATPDLQTHEGRTALMLASIEGSTRAALKLIPVSDVTIQDIDQKTALDHAFENGEGSISAFIIEKDLFNV